jgi:hypothetical protein
MDTTQTTTSPTEFPQVGTDAVAKLIELSRKVYLFTVTNEDPLTDEEDREFRTALQAAQDQTWDYSSIQAASVVPDPPYPED